jgi:hexosaminidase
MTRKVLCSGSALVGDLLISPMAWGAFDILGGYYNDSSTPFPARDSDFNLVGDAWFGWKADTIAGNLNLNQYDFQMQTGGGNVTTFNGALAGTGDFQWFGGGIGSWETTPSFLSGSAANTLSGSFTVAQGTLALNKPSGTNAIAGPLIIGGGGNQAYVQLNRSNQIKDSVPITMMGGFNAAIQTLGHSDSVGSLQLQSNGSIDLGSGASTFKFAASNTQNWDSRKTLTVQNYTPDTDHLYFGNNKTALTSAQVAQITFQNPAGKPAGVYAAELTDSGEIIPSSSPWVAAPPPSTDSNFKLVPYPQSVQTRSGSVTIGATSSVVVSSPSLVQLGSVLSNEIFALTGQRLNVRTGTPADGDIALTLDNNIAGEAYSMDVQNTAVISGGNYRAISQGTVTLLQSLKTTGGTISVPRVRIDDFPTESYRGAMIDLAREPTSIETIKKQIELNRLYKVPYLQLHLSDDQAFTFTVSSVDGINGHNFKGADDRRTMPTYTREQMVDLVKFADARGVTLIPEIEMPGHGAQLVNARPDLFRTGWYHHATLNVANPDAVTALKSILKEVSDVFQSSPYIHIGGDEADFSQLNYGNVRFESGHSDPTVYPEVRKQWDAKMDQLTAELRASGQIGSTQRVTQATEVYRDFLNQMDEYVKSLGKQTVVWEGFGRGGQVPVNKDIIVMSFENAYYRPENIVADGFTDINASWSPLYVVAMQDDAGRAVSLAADLEEIYKWNKQYFDVYYGNVTPTSGTFVSDAYADMILGGQLVAWENTEAVLIESMRQRIAAMSEKLWTPDAPWTFDDFSSRLLFTDGMLDKLFLANSMPVIAVPEPTTSALVALGCLLGLRRRRAA